MLVPRPAILAPVGDLAIEDHLVRIGVLRVFERRWPEEFRGQSKRDAAPLVGIVHPLLANIPKAEAHRVKRDQLFDLLTVIVVGQHAEKPRASPLLPSAASSNKPGATSNPKVSSSGGSLPA